MRERSGRQRERMYRKGIEKYEKIAIKKGKGRTWKEGME